MRVKNKLKVPKREIRVFIKFYNIMVSKRSNIVIRKLIEVGLITPLTPIILRFIRYYSNIPVDV